ncbi:MAG TPA: DUF350 domain-containing protein, partial [Polyangia bacterium]
INGARALARAGGLAGGFVVLAAAVTGSGNGHSWRTDLGWVAMFLGVGLLLAAAGARLLDRTFLKAAHGASMATEIERRNFAAGVVSAGHRAAAGIVVGSCLYGADFLSLAVGSAFAALGIATLALFEILHQKLTHYADDQEVRGGNTAAALSAAGLALALSIIVAHAAEGHFTGWGPSLRAYFLALALALALYPVRQVLVKGIILGLPLSLRGRALDRAIAEQRNCSLGAVEGLTYVATALLVTSLL